MTLAFGYSRVSGKGQIEGDGFPRQLAAIKAYAKAHDIRVVRVFQEKGVSGAKESMDRPAWVEMMTALHSNGVRTIIIERLDRLARSIMIQEAAIAYLQKHGFALISAAEPDLMATDPSRKAFRQMMGVFAEFEKDSTVLKLRVARMRKRAVEGHCEGRKRYGFRPGEDAVIERMVELRAAGMGFDRIAGQLNAEGLKPRKGQRWWGASVNNTLSNV